MQPQTYTYTTTTPSQTPAQAPAAGLRVKTHIKAGAYPPSREQAPKSQIALVERFVNP